MMTQNGGDPIHIVGVEVSNFRRLRFGRVRLEKGVGLVRVTGGNAQGKTSFLRAIRETLGGAKQITAAEQTIHEGAESATTTLTLSNGFTVERRYSDENPKGTLVVRSGDGGRHSQTRLNDWLGPLAFDPLSFFALSPDKQADTLLKLGTDPELPKKLEQLKALRKEAYESRTPHLVAARNARAVQQPEGERPEPVDTSAEMKRLADLQREQRAREEIQQQMAVLSERGERGRAAVAELERRLAEARALLLALTHDYIDLEQKLSEMPDRSGAIEAVQGHIADAQSVNEQLKPWYAWDAAQRTVADADAAASVLTDQIEECDARKAKLLAESGIDIPGLGFDEDGAPLLNGRPLAAASGRERIELAVAVAMKANPQLRIALVDEANDLDLAALERLDELAREHDFQIWAVRIGLEGPGEVVVEDGVARSTQPEPEPVEEDERAEQDALAAASEAEAEAQGRAEFDLFEIDAMPGSAPF